MTEEAETVDASTASKRNRFKGAISRTKSKFRTRDSSPEDSDLTTNDVVEDFLAGGRTSTSTRPSISDSLSFASDRPSTADSLPHHPSPPTSTSDRFAAPQQPPRRIDVPRIDVSKSQRWPGALPTQPEDHDRSRFLRPEYQGRSQSVSSLSKGRRRSRGLSVTFIEAPPVIIGEGGDAAQTPPSEISRARARARSASPMPARLGLGLPPISFPVRRKPVPQPPVHASTEFEPSALQRVQTGSSAATQESKLAMNKEFEMSLGMGLLAGNHPGTTAPLHAPTPIRPPVSIPVVKELKSAPASSNLHMQFEDGKALKQGYPRDFSASSITYTKPYRADHQSKHLDESELSKARDAGAAADSGRNPPYRPAGNWL